MYEIELVLALLVPVAVLAVLARRLGMPYPVLLVLGGLALGFVPGLPHIALAPDLAFLLFLPPFLYTAAFFTSIQDFQANLRRIASLAIGLVLASIGVVAVVAHSAGAVWPGRPGGRSAAPPRDPWGAPPVEIPFSLLTPFAAYLPAEHLGLSGVLAVVAAGLSLGQRAARLMNAQTRLSGTTVWEFV